jgi:hypothetical protein
MVSLQVIRAKISPPLLSIDSGNFFFHWLNFAKKRNSKLQISPKKRKGSDFARFLVTRTEERKNK